MMKIVGKFVLVAGVAMVAASFTATPSFAAKKKAAAACTPGAWQKAGCVALMRTSQRCGFDGKWYPSLVTYPDATCAKK